MMRSRWLPHPLASVTLFAMWLMLNATVAFSHVVLGAFLAWVIPWSTRSLWPRQFGLYRGKVALRLFFVVLADIVRANIIVALLILGPTSKLRPGFVRMRVDLDEPFAASTLASIITLTPGTVSCSFSEDRRTLLIHALDMDDEAALIEEIKTRYEAPLKEIFQC
ncbi:MAG TPA: Na+/H+ antiporter subunit E [Noviherbaspirillum sp.]|nr:Na+/H+ antiporter subunit E [Noviherbaspirillum sp.]